MRRPVVVAVVAIAIAGLVPACSDGDGDLAGGFAIRSPGTTSVATSAPVIPTTSAVVAITVAPAPSVPAPTLPPTTLAPAPLPAPPPSATAPPTAPLTVPPTFAVPSTLPAPIDAPIDDGPVEPRVQIGQIEIPRLGLARTMFEGISLSTLDHGPGHWPGTAMPGAVGNVVVAGHRVSHNEDFRDLDQLVPGDEVIFTTATGRHLYRVVLTDIVGPEAVWIVEQTPAQTATLFACHPPGSTRQRIVVYLELSA